MTKMLKKVLKPKELYGEVEADFGEIEKHLFDDLVEVVVHRHHECNIPGCYKEALYDAKTIHGPWGYLCQEHFDAIGIGLGMGKGQRLIVKEI